MYTLYDRILGCLIGAAAGDAMGAATEARTTEQILEYFGHKVTDFEVTPLDTFAHGNQKGQVTDDFSSAYFIARSIIDHGGEISSDVVREAIIDWSGHPVFFDRFAGPTTRMAVRRFKGEILPESESLQLLPRQATNGAAMKISPIGLFNPGVPLQAAVDSAVVTMVTHDNYIAVSGGAAVAAAVAEAVTEGADLYSVIQAGLYGAAEGERIGREQGRDVAGPSVIRRMEMAVDIGLGRGSMEYKMREIAGRIGMGLHVAEAVPSAFGFLAASGGDAMEAIIAAVNAGYDTDTVGTMAGAMAGALCGASVFPEHFLPVMDEINGFDIAGLAGDIERTAILRRGNAK
ncbi:MAG: ADP-ribosylglycohydrolase family protein [Mogibacterium sp.]|nr:ADP-ribosylglycohydrolase family protein [Mogibacterium sp.]